LVIPDLWQQEAVRALQQGKDVVVQAPTGSGKTYIFELLYPTLKTQAVFTVPTRAVTTDSGTEPSSSTASWKAPSRASPTRAHALHPNLPQSPIMHHKPLMIEARITRTDEARAVIQIHGRSFHAS
jgi:Ni2+-binding GTPase involved in maturation of urease and hydrogenase